MKNLILLMLSLLFILPCVEAKTFKAYHYAPHQCNNANYYGTWGNYGNFRRHGVPRYNYPSGNYYYYNSKPLIYKRGARQIVSDETYVAGQFSGLKSMENRVFSQTFENETPQSRIERLEQKVFGALQSGSLDDRYSLLQNAIKNYKAYNPDNLNSYTPRRTYSSNGYNTYSNNYGYRPPIFTGSTGGGWKSMLLGNFRNQFTGMPTGFTPAMDPAYIDYFEAERAFMHNNESNGVRTRYGYRNSNTSTSGRTGVTILD